MGAIRTNVSRWIKKITLEHRQIWLNPQLQFKAFHKRNRKQTDGTSLQILSAVSGRNIHVSRQTRAQKNQFQ